MSDGPVIPDFGQASGCVRENRLFCVDWVADSWGTVLQPAVVQHVKLTLIAVAAGFAVALAAALAAHRHAVLERPFALASAILYTIPAVAAFQLLVPITGIGLLTVEIPLVAYTLLILFRNVLEGLRATPAEVHEAARGMGLTPRQTLWRVELPLALPAIVAGLRIATVSTIALATIAAFIYPEGLGQPIFRGLRDNFFKTEIVAAGTLAILLAVTADLLLVLLQRRITPWAAARRSA